MRFVFLSLVFIGLFGCVKRTISITSAPKGALVWINDREIGRTPVEFNFLYHGEYDLRLQLDAYEPIMTTRWTEAPLWDAPFVDFIAEIIPMQLEAHTSWHFNLEPRNDDPALLIQRARILRDKSKGDEIE